MKAVVCEQFRMTSTDGLQVVCARWRNRQLPRGLLQIAHGMGEHIGHYQVLIEELVHAGLVVYGKDHRGHSRQALGSTNATLPPAFQYWSRAYTAGNYPGVCRLEEMCCRCQSSRRDPNMHQ